MNGDMTKLRHVPGLGQAARKVLSNVEARAKTTPGTHEIRKTMRHQTHAYRVAYGTAVFVTFSPSEKDSALMVRLARARQSDPAVQEDGTAFWHRRDRPNLDVDFMRLSPEALVQDPWDGHALNGYIRKYILCIFLTVVLKYNLMIVCVCICTHERGLFCLVLT